MNCTIFVFALRKGKQLQQNHINADDNGSK